MAPPWFGQAGRLAAHQSKGGQSLLDGERKGPPELGQEGEARAMMQPPIEPQDTEARTVVQGGVLKRPAARDLHVLHVDLNRLSRFRLADLQGGRAGGDGGGLVVA